MWTLYGAMVRPPCDSIYPRYSQEVAWNSHLSAQAKSLLVQSLWSTWMNMGFVLRNVVGIDEDVIQIYDDYDVNNFRKNVVHKALKHGGCISKPFRHYHPLEGTVAGLKCSLPFISR